MGEISPDEFKHFIGQDIRLDPVKIDAHESIKEMLKFFMGKNTPERQQYIIRNLRFDIDIVDDDEKTEGEDDLNGKKKKVVSSPNNEVKDDEAA